MRHPPTGCYYNMGVLTPLPKPYSPYRWDASKVTEPEVFIRHRFGAMLDCAIHGWEFSYIPTAAEAASKEREALAWEPAGRFAGC